MVPQLAVYTYSRFFSREISISYYERVYYKKRRGCGTDRRSYENSEKGVASGVISGYGTDRRSYENSEKGVARNTYSLMKYIIKGVVIMSKFKEFKQKVKDNKGKIITSLLVIGGVTFVIVKQNGTIKQLKISDAKQSKDIAVLKSVMNENVLSSLKASLTRKLRYAEGKLNNGLIDGVMSKADEMLRREEIEFYSKELEKITEAEKLLK